MAHQGNHQKVIGDYLTLQEIGRGSFAVVWKAVHRVERHEVAIKEIATERLNTKLQENLLSEIAILRKTDHPNIIRLHDIVEEPNRLYLVLEYCAGGDLATYIQQRGKVSEEVAKHFMRQLGSGLQALRANNLIHRDLKPQNLLLSTNNESAVLKIADFGFARSLQPQGMAETLCGSPLYMAPEILQSQKYDAKADLWSVGTILFQLLTGRYPFFGNSPAQLLQNITKGEVQFPKSISADLHPDCIDLCRKLLRQNPVERLSFEEFFNHSFLALLRSRDEDVEVHLIPSAASESNENSQEESLPFLIDDERQGTVEIPVDSSKQSLFSVSPLNNLFPKRAVTKGFLPEKLEYGNESGRSPHVGSEDKQRTGGKQPISGFSRLRRSSETGFLESSISSTGMPATARERGLINDSPNKGVNLHSDTKGVLVDSMEGIERDYVLVNASMDTLSLSLGTSATCHHGSKGSGSPQKSHSKLQTPSVPVPVIATSGGSFGGIGSIGSHGSTPSGTSQESVDSGEILEGPSTHPPTRLSSLQQCARLITELATDKLDAGQSLESFSVQLVCLAIWKEALHVCHAWAAAAADMSSPFFEEEIGDAAPRRDGLQNTGGEYIYEGTVEGGQEAAAASACSRMEREFSMAVERAEDLATHIGSTDGYVEMPDAIEIIFQAALAVGRAGAVEELMGNITNAAVAYAKSAALLYFLLVEGSSLPLTPPLILSPSDRYRLRRYADMLTARQNQCTIQQNFMLQQREHQRPS
ncbi:hypothetical protein O6H91_19G078500 [Diphasiastrum complanatum]|uniref:Uncharacterized protein n=1 Tax=Diphasiastrum complanatum TaxID=34168 RepID=A0ACC2AWU0_DIPCM|nr:hypothetical protein O6H91_19G078500 [Diphasiastrum complanatum]